MQRNSRAIFTQHFSLHPLARINPSSLETEIFDEKQHFMRGENDRI